LTIEEASGPPIEVWPDNWQARRVFDAIATQWRLGMGGPTGLDYNVLYHKMDRMHLSGTEYDDLEAEIRVMEDAALTYMRRKQ